MEKLVIASNEDARRSKWIAIASLIFAGLSALGAILS